MAEEWEELMRSAAAIPAADPTTEESWQSVAGRLGLASTVRTLPSRAIMSTPRHRPRAWVALASLGATAGLVILFLMRARLVTGASHEQSYTTAAAQQEKVVLADGTRIMLAPTSRLRVSADFGQVRRDVYLEGEAYFAVVHDSRHPFVVHARNTVAQDVGTRFDVRAYAESPSVRVAVTEGQVNLTPIGLRTARPLQAGEVAEVADTAITVSRKADAGSDTAWVAGDLHLRDTPLPEAAALLGRWYDLDIDASDPMLASRLITLSVGHTSLNDLLAGIAAATHSRVERHGRLVTFTANPHDE